MREYKIIVAYGRKEMIDEINALIDYGWELEGGVSMDGADFAQAMTRHPDNIILPEGVVADQTDQ